ncbi:MAG: carboxylesterase/lipase family protein [Anaerolineae bacterium]
MPSATDPSFAPWKHRDTVQIGANIAVVETTSGAMRGYIRNGIYTFKGLPYGSPVSGAQRFMPAALAEPQPGVRACLHYGSICPQAPTAPINPGQPSHANDEDQFLLLRTGGRPVGEDCLLLNIWTPEINGAANRPVMVWLHGGGYAFGCGHDLAAYDGENLAHQDAVVVTINHRLGLLGHLNLAELGDARYASSGNIAMLDMMLALQWVRANIERFGGDPGNVTIFGQSGGGGKVSALMGMPSAKGLFQRAAIQSGSFPAGVPMEGTSAIAKAVLDELEITPNHLDKLHTLQVEALLKAGFAALHKLQRPMMMGWGPVVDGTILPEQPFAEQAPACSADVPLLVGTNMHEFISGVDDPNAYTMTESDLESKANEQFKAEAPALLAAYLQAFPDAAPFDRWSLMANWFRPLAQKQAEIKALQGAAPAYLYWFTWRTPVLDGRPGAFHSSEISYVFDNADRYEGYNGGGEEPRALSAQMSGAWLSFARTGNPNHAGLPTWPAYDPASGQLMRFDAPCRVEEAPDRIVSRIMAETK